MLSSYRRALHQIPELKLDTTQTATYIKNHLEPMKCELTSLIPNSICAYFDFGQEQTLAFRSDMDALPILEQNEIAYRSKNSNMHACGHDGHMSILLGFADHIDQLEQAPYNILLIFQPGEEDPGGAQLLIDAGLFERYSIDAIFGLHIYPHLPSGQIVSKKGVMMAGACDLNIEIYGKASHAAQPERGINALKAAAQFITKTLDQEEQLFEKDVYHLLHYGLIESGSAFNVVANHASIKGTIRYFDPYVFDQIVDLLKKELSILQERMGIHYDFSIDQHYPPLYNDQDLFENIQKEIPFTNLEAPVLIAEDFAFYGKYAPSFFCFIGSGMEEALHSDTFNFDESLLTSGVSFYIDVLNHLKIKKNT